MLVGQGANKPVGRCANSDPPPHINKTDEKLMGFSWSWWVLEILGYQTNNIQIMLNTVLSSSLLYRCQISLPHNVAISNFSSSRGFSAQLLEAFHCLMNSYPDWWQGKPVLHGHHNWPAQRAAVLYYLMLMLIWIFKNALEIRKQQKHRYISEHSRLRQLKWVLSWFWNERILGTARAVARRSFHMRGATDEKRRDEVLVLEQGMFNWSSANKCTLCDGVYCCISDDRYVGELNLYRFQHNSATLYTVLDCTGGQCSSCSRSLVQRPESWSLRMPMLKTIRAKLFWSCCIRPTVTLYKSAWQESNLLPTMLHTMLFAMSCEMLRQMWRRACRWKMYALTTLVMWSSMVVMLDATCGVWCVAWRRAWHQISSVCRIH